MKTIKAQQIKIFFNAAVLFMRTLFLKFKKQIIQLVTAIFLIILLHQVFLMLTTKVFYYLNKDNHSHIIKEHRKIIPITTETSLQALIRIYLDGSEHYMGELPFSDETKLLSISHNSDTKYLVLNWNGYFLRNLNDNKFDKDITVLLKTIHKNSSVEKVYFLVEGKKINIPWRNSRLDSGIVLKNMNFNLIKIK